MKTISTWFIFFVKNFPAHKKHTQANVNQQSKIKQTLNNKGNSFLRVQKLLKRWKSFVLRLVFFVRLKPFCKKETNMLEIVLITSLLFYYSTTGYFVVSSLVIRTKKSNVFFLQSLYSMKAIQQNPYIIESSDSVLKMMYVTDLSLILFSTSWWIYSILKETTYPFVKIKIIIKLNLFLYFLCHRRLWHTLHLLF